MGRFSTNLAPDHHFVTLVELVEGTGPRSVAFLLAVFTVVIVQHAQSHHIIGFQQLFKLVVLFPFQNIVHFLHTLFQVIIIIRHNYYMQRLEVLENVFLLFVRSSASNSNLALTSLFDQLLCLPLRPYNLPDIVCLRVVCCAVCQVDFLVFLQRFVVIWGDEGLPHLHAILDEGDPLALERIALADFTGVEPAAIFVIDGLRTG